jgi:hypothetical protein
VRLIIAEGSVDGFSISLFAVLELRNGRRAPNGNASIIDVIAVWLSFRPALFVELVATVAQSPLVFM